MRRTFQKVSILALMILFTFSVSPDVFSKGFRSSGRSYGSRSSSSSRSVSKTKPSRSSTRSSSKSYGGSTRSTKSSVRSTSPPAGQRSGSKSYGRSSVQSSQKSAGRQSSAIRQKQNAMSRAKTGSAVSTKNMTSSQKRGLKAQQRKTTRNLKAENRSLKRQVSRADRNTARVRRDARQARSRITVNNFGSYYPNPGYSIYSLTASMVFANAISGIYFHDHYNHRVHYSWLRHHHHSDYDRSHWSRERQREYARWRAYYDSQGIQADRRYVDPRTNRDEDYIDSHVDKNADQFYGSNAQEAVTVEELPDEDSLRDIVLAGGGRAVQTSAIQARPQRVVVQKKTSGGTWFVLVFGSVLIIGIVVLIMYNKGYF